MAGAAGRRRDHGPIQRSAPTGCSTGANTLYVVAPANDQRRLSGLFTALVSHIVAGAYERSAQAGRPIDPALLLALDEVANIAPLPGLDELASTGPGQGVHLLCVLQNISQAYDRWGRDRAETIIANHRARLFCSGIGDRATLDYLAARSAKKRSRGSQPSSAGSPLPAQRPAAPSTGHSPHRTASAKPTAPPACSSTAASRPPGSPSAPATQPPARPASSRRHTDNSAPRHRVSSIPDSTQEQRP